MVFIAEKRQHDQGTSFKGQHLTWADLLVQRFSQLSSCQELRQHTGRYCAGEGTNSAAS